MNDGDIMILDEVTNSYRMSRLAQSVEHQTLNLRVVGSSPTLGDIYFINGYERKTLISNFVTSFWGINILIILIVQLASLRFLVLKRMKARQGTRTLDPQIKSLMLYRLS